MGRARAVPWCVVAHQVAKCACRWSYQRGGVEKVPAAGTAETAIRDQCSQSVLSTTEEASVELQQRVPNACGMSTFLEATSGRALQLLSQANRQRAVPAP